MDESEITALTAHVVNAIDTATASAEPFHPIVIDDVFPGDIYTRMLALMPTANNHGYAFAVGDDTWHSVDACADLPISRDSILHTDFVDRSPLQVLRNRGKRIGNFIQNEVRSAIS